MSPACGAWIPIPFPAPACRRCNCCPAWALKAAPKALLVHGSNVVVSAPNADDVARSLGRLDLLVVADIVPSETASYADVVLPVTQWAEEEGTMTNLEGRVLRRRKAVDAPGEARSELWMLSRTRPTARM